MKKLSLLLILIVLLTGCGGGKVSSDASSSKFSSTDLISIAVPTLYEDSIKYVDTISRTKSLRNVDSVPNDNSLLASLSDLVSSVTVYETNQGGSISLMGNTASLKNKTYKVIYDFSQTQTIQKDTLKLSVGIAVRMIAEVTTNKSGIDLTDIFSIGLNAENEKLSGSLTVRSIGISSQKVNQSIPTTTDLSPSSIATALQTIATIKSSIYDEETVITPYVIGFSVGVRTDYEAVNGIINKMNL
jgi:hypothetical protein